MPTGAGLAVSLIIVVLLGVVVFRALLRRGQREAHVEAFRLACRELASLTGAETVSAYVLDRSATELRPIAGSHIPCEALPVLGTTPLPLDAQGFAATVFQAGRPVWSDDVCGSGEPVVLADVTEEAPDARNLAWMRVRGVVSAAVALEKTRVRT